MKTFTITLAFVLLSLGVSAQQYVQFGLHGGYGSTWMINNNVSDQGSNLDPQISFAGIGGIHAMCAFTPSVGLQLEINTTTVKQKYKSETTTPVNKSDITTRLHYIEVPVLVMLKSSGFYFEIGPKFSFLGKSQETATNSNILVANYDNKDIKTGLKNTLISGVLGLGGEFPLTKNKNLMLNAGLRFAYAFNDATKEYSSSASMVSDYNKIGTPTIAAHFDQQQNFSYKATHIATGMVQLGISYRLAFAKK